MPHPTASRLLVIVYLLAVAAPGALAAEDPDPDFSLENTIQAGPLHVAPFLVVKDFGYDDNVRLDSRKRDGDYTMTLGPGLRGVIPLGRMAAFAFRDELGYTYFAQDSDLNYFNNSLRTKLHVYLRDLTLFADGGQDSFRDRPNTEIDFRIRHVTTHGKFGVTYRPVDRGEISLYTRLVDENYDPGKPEVGPGDDPVQAALIGDAVARSLNRTEQTFGMQTRLKVRPRTSLLLETEAGGIDFDLPLPDRDSDTISMMAGLEIDPSGPLRGYLKAGRKHVSPTSDSIDGFSGWIADAKVSMHVFGRGHVKAGFLRDTVFSTLGDNLYYLEVRRALAYEHYMSRRASVEIGRDVSDIDYPVPLTGQTPPHRRDDIITDRVSFRYEMRPGMRVGLSVGRWERDSTIDSEDRTRNTIQTLLEYEL